MYFIVLLRSWTGFYHSRILIFTHKLKLCAPVSRVSGTCHWRRWRQGLMKLLQKWPNKKVCRMSQIRKWSLVQKGIQNSQMDQMKWSSRWRSTRWTTSQSIRQRDCRTYSKRSSTHTFDGTKCTFMTLIDWPAKLIFIE